MVETRLKMPALD
jgi:uracil-DNA glycosylase family 4